MFISEKWIETVIQKKSLNWKIKDIREGLFEMLLSSKTELAI